MKTLCKLYYSDGGSGPVVSLNDVAKILGLRDGGVLSRLADLQYLRHVYKNGLFAADTQPRKGLWVCACDDGVRDIATRVRSLKARPVLIGLASLMDLLTATDDGKKNIAYLVYEKKQWRVADSPAPVGATSDGIKAKVAEAQAHLDSTKLAPAETDEQIGMYQEVALAHLETVPGCQAQVMPNKDVARAMGVKGHDLRNHKMRHPELLQEGVHCVVLPVTGSDGSGPRDTLCWSAAGVEILASELIRTPRAQEFRRLARLARTQVSEAQIRTLIAAELNSRTPYLLERVADAVLEQSNLAVNRAIQPIRAQFNQSMEESLAVKNKSQALIDELMYLKDKTASMKEPWLKEEAGVKIDRTINRRDPLCGEPIPSPFCSWWSLTSFTKDPRFVFPTKLAAVCSKKSRPDQKFFLRWLAKHGYLRVEGITDPGMASRLERNWLWAPVKGADMIENVTYWFRCDHPFKREFSSYIGAGAARYKPTYMFQPDLVQKWAELWTMECMNGQMGKFASDIYPSWFKSGGAKQYLADYGYTVDLNRPDVPDDPSESGEEDTPTK